MPSDPHELYSLARRHNDKRALLVVSTVLGKHIPVDARTALAAGRLLAERVNRSIHCSPPVSNNDGAELRSPSLEVPPMALTTPVQRTNDVVVVGFCETAVALGAIVAQALNAPYTHSTRYPRDNQHLLCAFTETHSHAPDHVIAHFDPNALAAERVLVLVDDELTTGRTAAAAIEQIHGHTPQRRYVIAALLDWRTTDADIAETASRIGVPIDVVALHRGDVTNLRVPNPSLADTAFRCGVNGKHPAGCVLIHRFADVAPATPFTAGAAQARADASRIADSLRNTGVDAVIGVEECMFLPILVAELLGTTVQSTTLSPVVVSDQIDYPIRSVVEFTSPFGHVDTYTYNIEADRTVAVITDGGDLEHNTAMAEAIAEFTGRIVHLVLTGAAANR